MIEIGSISKRFGGVTALADVSLSILKGSCHAVFGASGAGKSVLMNILAGVERADAGRVELDGKPFSFASPKEAARAGVAIVSQRVEFCAELSVAENVCMGQGAGRFGMVSRSGMERRARELLMEVGLLVDVRRAMGELDASEQKLAQLARTVGVGTKLVILDEPLESLSDAQGSQVLDVIERLRADGVTVVYASRRLPNMVMDRVSILRDGRHVGMLEREEASDERVWEMMAGRKVEAWTPKHLSGVAGHARLSVKGLGWPSERIDFVILPAAIFSRNWKEW